MNNPIVSIIMPVYKVEEYVGKSIESIQKQSFQNWELWAVDDGTPDNSGKICDEYAAKDSRIHVIHKENGGAPSARNTAMKQATGKYFYFMDSDDWAEPTMLEDMVNHAEKHNLQLLVTGFYIDTYYTDTEKYTQIQKVDSKVYASQQEFRKEAYKLFDKNLLYTPWNKLFLASYLKENNLYFPTTFWDDFPFCLSVVRNVERVAVLETPYYHFIRKRAESETAKYNPRMYEKREEEHQWMLDLYNYWNISDSDSIEMISRRYVERLIGCVENLTNIQCSLTSKEKKTKIKQMITANHCRTALKHMKPQSNMMKLMLLPIKMQNGFLTYCEGCTISKVKSSNTKLFARLKAER